MNKKSGFTLVEIMIAVGIILILAVIAIPNMLRGKVIANETGAITALKTLSNACNLYTFNNNEFPGSFNDLSSTQPPYVTYNFSNPKDGYSYAYAGGGSSFSIIASPIRWRVTGVRSFYVNPLGIISYCSTNGCTPRDSDPDV